MKTILLYGHLGKQFGRKFKFDVKSPAEAISALRANVPGFQSYLMKYNAPGYRVMTGKEIVPEAKFLEMHTGRPVIRIVPVVAGAGGDSPFGIILGIALIVMSGGFGLMATPMLTGAIGSMAMSMGVSMVLGGISSLLSDTGSSTPVRAERPTNLPSYAFNGAINTTQQGNPVPILYGKLVVGSQVISAGLRSEDMVGFEGGGSGGEQEHVYVATLEEVEGLPQTAFVIPDEDYVSHVKMIKINPTIAMTEILDTDWTAPFQYYHDGTTYQTNGGLGTYHVTYNKRVS